MVLLTCVLGQLEVPEPVITLHSGHIGLYDRLLETQFNGDIETGEPYTLDIYMGNTEEYDYAIENCVFNSRLSFMDSYGWVLAFVKHFVKDLTIGFVSVGTAVG